jgi:hypothetical protein
LLTCHTNVTNWRHNDVVEVVMDMLRAVSRHVTREPYGLPGYGQRRPDLEVLQLWAVGLAHCIIDVTITHPTAATTVGRIAIGDASKPCYAAEKAASRKRAENDAICQGIRRDFRPFAVETTGALGKDARDIIKRAAALRDDLEPANGRGTYGDTWTVATFQEYWTQRIVAAVHKWNFCSAKSVLVGSF